MGQAYTQLFEKDIDGYIVRVLNILLKDEENNKRQIISVPSQIGCHNQCSFCVSKDQALVRNLTAIEILDLIELVPKDSNNIEVSFTGEGEPLHNIKNLNVVLKELGKGNRTTSAKIAFSGSGSHLFEKLESPIPITVQFSLHHANEQKRRELVPRSDKLDIIKDNLKKFEHKFKKININYVLMEGKNNSKEDLSLLDEFVANTEWTILFNPLMTETGLEIADLTESPNHKRIKLYRKIGESIIENDFYNKLTFTKK